ncbi:hypothetical protein FHS19_002874 [Paenibacillus rhizosphaerae]|uniref:Lipoprotein n=1 Tax=Paenibacillus rhizosphaerae TaxID=297318 RepID=A0A839TRC2_9BACL|nr:hypothetical protein [Paenibacillus rhizosphaerae]MBB3128220.1 hypothetical protein [Paenibacillus rhizosphaerae]
MKKLFWSIMLIGSVLSLSACSSGDKDMGNQMTSEGNHVQNEMGGTDTKDMMGSQDMKEENMNSEDTNMMEPSQKGMGTDHSDMPEKDATTNGMGKGGM